MEIICIHIQSAIFLCLLREYLISFINIILNISSSKTVTFLLTGNNL